MERPQTRTSHMVSKRYFVTVNKAKCALEYDRNPVWCEYTSSDWLVGRTALKPVCFIVFEFTLNPVCLCFTVVLLQARTTGTEPSN